MFKLKMIKKPILFKLKCDFTFPPIVLANMQEKEAIPTKEQQEIVPDKNYDGLSKVTVQKIPTQYIIPSGNIQITENGTYDITSKESVNVDVQPNLQIKSATPTTSSQNITADEGYNGLSSVSISAVDSSIDSNIVSSNIKNGISILGVTGTLNEGITPSGELAITENGTYDVTNYASANVNVEGSGGADLNEYFETTFSNGSTDSWVKNNFIKKTPDLVISDSITSLDDFVRSISFAPKVICNSNIKSMRQMYYQNNSKNIDVSGLTTNNVTNMSDMFSQCSSLTSLDLSNFSTNNVTNMSYMFYRCSSLTSLDLSSFVTSKVTDMSYIFCWCSKLTQLDIRNFDFTNVTFYDGMFNNASKDCLIIVKDDTAKTWLTSKFNKLTNVKTVAELEQ